MFKAKFLSEFASLFLLIFFLANISFESTVMATNDTRFPRNLVSVWLDSPYGYSTQRYRPSRVTGMIKLISGTFGSIGMDNVPIMETFTPLKEIYNSKVLIPIKAAEHNNKSRPEERVKVMVSFDLSLSSRSKDHPTHLNSFVVAKHYADEANTIFPGTVDTLLLHHDDYLRVQAQDRQGHTNIPEELHTAWTELNQHNIKAYKLAVTVSLNLCGTTENNSSEILSQFVNYADIVVPVVYVGSVENFTPCEEHNRQLELIQNCESNLKELKANVETIPIVICRKPRQFNGFTTFGQCWKLMSDWAKRNNRKVIMYEVFNKMDGEYVGGNGWWRLKNQGGTGLENSNYERRPQGANVLCTVGNTLHLNGTNSPSSIPLPSLTLNETQALNMTLIRDITELLNSNFGMKDSIETNWTIGHNPDASGEFENDKNVTSVVIVPNNYTVTVASKPAEDTRNYSSSKSVTTEGKAPTGSSTGIIVIIICLILFLVLASVSAIWFYAKHKRNKASVSYHSYSSYRGGDAQVLL